MLIQALAMPPRLPDSKLYQAQSETELVPFVPPNRYQRNITNLGTRLIISTNLDRVEMFKRLLDFYAGPFFITLVIQEPHGAFEEEGRYTSEPNKTRVQIDYFLDYFHEYISFGGMFHLWVTCQETDGIIVYDQHDYFFVYERADEASEMLEKMGFEEGFVEVDFPHAHSQRIDIFPGTKEMLEYGQWRLTQLEIQDVARPEAKTLRNAYLKVRTYIAIQKIRWKKKK